MKKYQVDFDMKYSKAVVVSAKSKKEAKLKAFNTLVKNLKQSHFNINIES